MVSRGFFAGQGSRPSISSGAVTPFLLTDIGEGIAEVEILKWFKKEGDTISEFEELCEVQSDKATVIITSPYEGKVTRVYYKTGDIAKTGLPLIDVLVAPVDGDSAASPGPAADSAAPPAQQSQGGSSESSSSAWRSEGKVRASPAVRRLARIKNLDLSSVVATGRDGRVLKGDVLLHQEGSPPSPPPPPAPSSVPPSAGAAPLVASAASAGPAVVRPAAQAASQPLQVSALASLQDKRETLRGVRKAMVKSMTPAAAVPWFGYSDEIEMDGLMAARSLLRKHVEEQGIKLTYMPFIIKATATALSDFGVLNSSLSADLSELIYRGSVNLGVAMDTPAGLVVPNIKSASQRSVLEIAVELARLQGLAQSGRLGPEDLSGGTFTISNIGNIGGTNLSPVPMPGEVAIGAIGRIRKLPRFNEAGAVVPRHVMEVSWRADHRVIDGATLARFSEAWRGYIEQPLKMLIKLR